MLDVCAQHFKHVHACYMYLVPGMHCLEAPLEAYVRRYKNVTLHKLPHFELAHYLKHSVLRPHTDGADDIKDYALKGAADHMRQLTGAEWIGWGWRRGDSFIRRKVLNNLGVVSLSQRIFYPLADWSRADVFSYMRAKRLEVPKQVGAATGDSLVTSGFDVAEAKSLRWVKANYPADYARVLAMFPFAEVMLARDQFYPDAVPEVPARGPRKKRDQTGAIQPPQDGQVGRGEDAEEPEKDGAA